MISKIVAVFLLFSGYCFAQTQTTQTRQPESKGQQAQPDKPKQDAQDPDQDETDKHDYDKPFGFGLEVRPMLFTSGQRLGIFSNFPLQARTIPSHPDDGWIMPPGTPRIVSDSPINIRQVASLGFALMPQYTLFSRLVIRGGLNIHFVFRDKMETGNGNDGSSREVNQYGTPEAGVGMSLVYYSIQNSSFWSVRPAGELELRIQKYFAILGGYTNDKTKLRIENGYDRWAAIQPYKTFPLATMSFSQPYVGVKIGEPLFGILVFASTSRPRLTMEPGMQDVIVDLSTRRYAWGFTLYIDANKYRLKK
ncbi:MAG: hypothetical protein ABR875_00385 [Minisyncoccia bacterium]|jgi:hypothetical protein